jgi:hypothetical protein
MRVIGGIAVALLALAVGLFFWWHQRDEICLQIRDARPSHAVIEVVGGHGCADAPHIREVEVWTDSHQFLWATDSISQTGSTVSEITYGVSPPGFRGEPPRELTSGTKVWWTLSGFNAAGEAQMIVTASIPASDASPR